MGIFIIVQICIVCLCVFVCAPVSLIYEEARFPIENVCYTCDCRVMWLGFCLNLSLIDFYGIYQAFNKRLIKSTTIKRKMWND